MTQLRYDGRVAVVTGSGSGLGRQYALFLASRGAKVVVNDIGLSIFGAGQQNHSAQKVVKQIKQKGGEAVASIDSVLNGDKIIQLALDTWGRIDILINNAGIVSQGPLHLIKEQFWHKLVQVHLTGSFKCTRAAWNIMRKQKYGRIVNTSSVIGLYGYKYISHYATAKSGINGFTMSLSKEGAKNNIFTNSVAPLALTRMTNQNPDFKPYMNIIFASSVVPLVAYLCHQSCPQNGGIFQSGGGYNAKVRWQRSQGILFDPKEITPESVRDNFKKICSFSGKNEYPKDRSKARELLQKARARL